MDKFSCVLIHIYLNPVHLFSKKKKEELVLGQPIPGRYQPSIVVWLLIFHLPREGVHGLFVFIETCTNMNTVLCPEADEVPLDVMWSGPNQRKEHPADQDAPAPP